MSKINNDGQIVFEYLKGFFLSKYPENTYLLGDHSFYYNDDRDTIIVYVKNNQILVILDGLESEVHSVSYSTPVYSISPYESKEDREFVFNKTYLQPILALL